MNVSEFYTKQFKWDSDPFDLRLIKTKRILQAIGWTHKWRIFDYGCGEGRLLTLLKGTGYTYLAGCDVSPASVEMARKAGHRVHFGTTSDYSVLEAAKGYNLITVIDVLEHVFDPDVLITEALKVLDKDGYLLISTPNMASWYNRLFLLFGYQPINVEAGTMQSDFGYAIKLGGQSVGHIRTMTRRALFEMVKHCGGYVDKEFAYDVDPVYYNNPLVKAFFWLVNMLTPKRLQGHMVLLIRKGVV